MPLPLIAEIYPILQHCQRLGLSLEQHADEALRGIAAAGLDGVEFERLDTPDTVGSPAALEACGLLQISCYMGGTLHGEDAPALVDRMVRRAAGLLDRGVRIIVLNPDPIDWNQPLDKDDAALWRQAAALNGLGERLRRQGQTLAYHTHDAEMRCGAREFHHMLAATNPEAVRWCLDTHWIFRGSGGSQVAVEDAIRLYGPRCAAVHVRQSLGGVWSETFGPGDLDHVPLFQLLGEAGFKGPVILEQATESGTPQTRPFYESLRLSATSLREQLAIAGW